MTLSKFLLFASLLVTSATASDTRMATLQPHAKDEDITAMALASAKPTETTEPAHPEDSDIGNLNGPAAPIVAEKAGTLLPVDVTAAPLPGQKPYDHGESVPLIWKDTPIEVGMEQLAHAYGVQINLSGLSKGDKILLSGDVRGVPPRNVLVRLAMQHHLVVNEANGAFSLLPAKLAPKASEPKPIIASKTVTIPIESNVTFLHYYQTRRTPQGTISFLGRSSEAIKYRINDSPYVLRDVDQQALGFTAEYANRRSTSPKLAKEHKKLESQREQLLAKLARQE